MTSPSGWASDALITPAIWTTVYEMAKEVDSAPATG